MSEPIPGTSARKRLGERLLDRGLLTASQLDMALHEQKRTGALLGEILLRLGCLTPRNLAQVLAEQGGVPFVDLAEVAIAPEVLARVPEGLARRHGVLPLDLQGGELKLAMANIFDQEALAAVEAFAGLRASVVCATEEDLHARAAQAYGGATAVEEVIEAAIRAAQGEGGGTETPIASLVDHLLQKALRDRATDLHLQPGESTILTRFRVDGSLVQGPSLPKALQAALLARLKVLAEVDISESRRPQDGKFRLPHGRRVFDVRASFLPAQHGEKAVLRFLDKTSLVQGLDDLGMPPRLLGQFTALLGRPHGVILVTGPTGSGKTTTLYSALARLNSADRCIVTVEDPVEYELPLIAQVAVNPKAGITFASGLRAILRQDPDIILVGEIRDAETAGITLRAAMTGHLVLATLHCNDPIGALPRLKELGVSSQELASALLGIHAQRLVRLNCPACARPTRPDPEVLLQAPGAGAGPWMKGAGCAACGGTGIRGRRAIHDLLPVTSGIRDRIAAGAPYAAIGDLARSQGKGTLRAHALALAAEGLISLDEVVRVTVEEA